MRVIRRMQTGHADYKFCALTLYALQIASANMKNLHVEPGREGRSSRDERRTADAPAILSGNGDAAAREALPPRTDEKKDVARVELAAEESLLKR